MLKSFILDNTKKRSTLREYWPTIPLLALALVVSWMNFLPLLVAAQQLRQLAHLLNVP